MQSLARRVLLTALLLGIAADLLLRRGFEGVAFPLWIALLALAAVSLVRIAGRSMPDEARGWLSAAVCFAAGLAWRDSPTLQFLDFLATLWALGMTAITLSDARAALAATRLRDTLWAWARIAREVLVGALPLALRELFRATARDAVSRRGWPIVRASVIAVVLLLVFGSLLREADPIFASLIALPELDLGLMLSHVLVTGFFAWVVAGWARGALLDGAPTWRAPDRLPFTIGMLDITVALVTLNVLFALFIGAQLGWFFGGEQFLRERTGLTAAAYARQGFFQMTAVVALVVPLLVATRAVLQPGREVARRHTALSLPLIALLGAIIVSAMLRMRMYVQYYGLTTDRFYPLVFMGWLALVLLWLAVTVLRDRGGRFVAGVIVSGLVVLALLNVAAPDAIVARVNIARAGRLVPGDRPGLDVAHLASLSGEAATLAVQATLAPPLGAEGSALRHTEDEQRCVAARRLRARWGVASRAAMQRREPGGWRGWNVGETIAMRAVAAHEPALRDIERTACAATRAQRPAMPPSAS
jgi:hypothetical protein